MICLEIHEIILFPLKVNKSSEDIVILMRIIIFLLATYTINNDNTSYKKNKGYLSFIYTCSGYVYHEVWDVNDIQFFMLPLIITIYSFHLVLIMMKEKRGGLNTEF